MSVQPATGYMPLPNGRNGGRAQFGTVLTGLSTTGVLTFLIGLAVVGSGYSALRPVIMGLALHPYLIFVALGVPLVVVARLGEFPVRILVALSAFCGMYFLSVFNGHSVQLNEIFKVTATVMSIVTCALLVRRQGDFVAGALGLAIAVALLAVKGLQAETVHGIEAIEGANRNSYSIYALPSILLAGYITLNLKTTPTWVKAVFIGCTLPTLVVIFLGANRSGYVGAVFIGLMLFWDRRGKAFLLVGTLAALVAFWIVQYGSTVVLNERIRQTVEGNRSDTIRKEIVLICLQIGLENPIVGVSPQLLPFEIGRRVPAELQKGVIDPHNVYAFLFAGSGIICFAALLGIGWAMWSWRPRGGGKIGGADDPLRDPVRLLRMMVALSALRGLFTREVLYNPSFGVALGLCIGWCILADAARKPRGNSRLRAA